MRAAHCLTRTLIALATALTLHACSDAGTADAPQASSPAANVLGPFTFICGDDPFDTLTAEFINGASAYLLATRGGITMQLPSAVSASGARYAGDGYEFWEHQGEVSLTWGVGAAQERCVPREAALEPGGPLWIEAVEQRVGSGDGAGHGPDVGSVEWMGVVSQRLGLDRDNPAPGSPEWYQAVETALAPGERP